MDNEAQPYLLTEAAELTGLSVDALRKRITRRKIRADRSNENRQWRVWLTTADIEAAKAGRLDGQSEMSTGQLARQVDKNSTIKAMEGTAAALRDALARERELSDRARAEAAEQRDRAARAEGERDTEKAARERAEAAITQLRIKHTENEVTRDFWSLGARLRWALTRLRR